MLCLLCAVQYLERDGILTEQDIDDAKLKEVIDKTGYEIGTVTREPYEKKGLFSAFRHEK